MSALLLASSPALVASAAAKAGTGLLNLLVVAIVVFGLGFGLGCFAFVVNKLFRKRSAVAFEVMQRKPKLSMVTGAAVSLLTFGFIASLHGKGGLQFIILLTYLCTLGAFALSSLVRLSARFLMPPQLASELPDPRAHIKGGILILAVNVVPIIGSVLFFGILLAGVGSALLSYFASFDGQSKAATPQQGYAPGAGYPPGVGRPPSG